MSAGWGQEDEKEQDIQLQLLQSALLMLVQGLQGELEVGRRMGLGWEREPDEEEDEEQRELRREEEKELRLRLQLLPAACRAR